jgi:Arc/MetJ-type ribon-helix-helix transcriptional regulator
MALKTLRTSIRLDKEDVDFLNGLGIFKSRSDGIRFAVKLMPLNSIPTIKAIAAKQEK